MKGGYDGESAEEFGDEAVGRQVRCGEAIQRDGVEWGIAGGSG